TSVSCLEADDCASAEIYLAPAASSADLMAASSVFQRSSWKLDQDTPTTSSCARTAVCMVTTMAAPAINLMIDFMLSSRVTADGQSLRALPPPDYLPVKAETLFSRQSRN